MGTYAKPLMILYSCVTLPPPSLACCFVLICMLVLGSIQINGRGKLYASTCSGEQSSLQVT